MRGSFGDLLASELGVSREKEFGLSLTFGISDTDDPDRLALGDFPPETDVAVQLHVNVFTVESESCSFPSGPRCAGSGLGAGESLTLLPRAASLAFTSSLGGKLIEGCIPSNARDHFDVLGKLPCQRGISTVSEEAELAVRKPLHHLAQHLQHSLDGGCLLCRTSGSPPYGALAALFSAVVGFGSLWFPLLRAESGQDRQSDIVVLQEGQGKDNGENRPVEAPGIGGEFPCGTDGIPEDAGSVDFQPGVFLKRIVACKKDRLGFWNEAIDDTIEQVLEKKTDLPGGLPEEVVVGVVGLPAPEA